jgi:hypothetical protein
MSLALRSLLRSPVRSLLAILQHYTKEFAFRLSPRTLETVEILSADGCGARVIESLIPLLRSSAVVVKKSETLPPSCPAGETGRATPCRDTPALTLGEYFDSMGRLVTGLMERWRGQFFGKRDLTLKVGEGWGQSLLVAPQACGYDGPMWFARLVCSLFPSPDLWIMLDPAPECSSAGIHEPSHVGAQGQIEAYRALVTSKKRHVILDAAKPTDCVIEDAYSAIIDMLARRAERRLASRFDLRAWRKIG